MDFSDEPPVRYWITDPSKHPEHHLCGFCGEPVDTEHSIPVVEQQGNMWAACPTCARREVRDHPWTVEYLKWMETGDPRWWSPWMCNHCAEIDGGP